MLNIVRRIRDLYRLNRIVPLVKSGQSIEFKIPNDKIKKVVKHINLEELKVGDVKKISIFKNGDLINFIFLVLPEEEPDLFSVAELGRKTINSLDKKELKSIDYTEIEALYKSKNSYRFSRAFFEGMLYGLYTFDKYKEGNQKHDGIEISISEKFYDFSLKSGIVDEMNILFKNIYMARDLINTPPNDLTPHNFASFIKGNSNDKLNINVLYHGDIKENGLNLIYAVGNGSEHKPCLVRIDYEGKPESKDKIVLVGKGVTFDSGGTNLKPTGSIETMKSDMSGAASVYAIMKSISESSLPVNVTAFLPLVENTIGATAYRPGDIIRSFSGKTVEVLNTDAEGRLVLADSLSMALKENPSLIIDMATLTGACVVALGSNIAGYFSNDDNYACKLEKSFVDNYEDICRLPLYAKYKDRLKSKIADLQNISKKRTEAGAIIGALFLQEFVGNSPWIHIDIAGPAFIEDNHPVFGEGGSGYGIRSLYNFIKCNFSS
ncbi:MAG: leucyl aminopeptidase family protein [Calditerrivibrio sp.]|nr:leucyl aminopeptidase family protein [Calditerrivibrio sp.]